MQQLEQFFLHRNGVPSATRTAFFAGFIICLLKLVFSGFEVGSIKLDLFTGSDFAMAVGALGAVYSLDKKVNDGK